MTARPTSVEELLSNLRRHGRSAAAFRQGDRIAACRGMRNAAAPGYSYVLEAPQGRDFAVGFEPALSPAEMLLLGVFEGKYLNDCTAEFPLEWFVAAASAGRLSPARPDMACNLFGVKSRQPLSIWKQNGWAPSANGRLGAPNHYHGVLADPSVNPDERGWFQWYCRYWMGRRLPQIDAIQIARWRAFRRHAGAIRAAARCPGDLTCRPRERQALLQWAYDPFI